MTNNFAKVFPMSFLSLFSLLLLPSPAHAKTVRYEINITQGPANMSGKETVPWAMMINGTIPAPTLEFTEGDDAEIIVNNINRPPCLLTIEREASSTLAGKRVQAFKCWL